MHERGYEGFEYPAETKCDIFRPFVEQILRALGWEPDEYWLSDESIIADFAVEEEDLIKAKQLLDIEFSDEEIVWEVAARLKAAFE